MARFATSIELREHVLKTASDLPPQQRTIADYLIHHMGEVPFLALPELADLTKVSEPTIVRFAQSIGFGGYRDLRMEMLQLPTDKKTSPPTDLTPIDAPQHVLHSVANLEIENIRQTTQVVDLSIFERIAEALYEADHTYVFGMGVSGPLAIMAQYIFTQVGVPCTVLSTYFSSPAEQVFTLRPSDLLLAFSFPPYSRQTLDILRGAVERGASTAAITNGLAAPACAVAKWTLTVQTYNMMYTNAVAAINVLVNALATQYAAAHRGRSLKAFAHTSKSLMNSQDISESGGKDEE
jgi:DNA-binding MurR/RpiR family transcriptional regulator